MYKINKKNKIIIISIFILLFCVVGYYIYAVDENVEIETDNEFAMQNTTQENQTEDNNIKKKNNIIVHVAGAVKNPGIIELSEDSRVSDAIEKAGGLTEEADIKKINLAQFLEDGIKIYIPTHNEIEEENIMEEEILDSSNNETNKKININTATQSDLENLPGIGESTAIKIINYRNENGKFKSIEDIKNVKGIGDSKFEKIRELIIVK